MKDSTIEAIEAAAEVTLTDYQLEALDAAVSMPGPQQRLCLYYRTGAGKSITAISCVRLWGYHAAVVVAPPSTHPEWEALGRKLGVEVEVMSHAKFRMKDTKLSRLVPIIMDEMHLLGGHTGKGWKKLDTLARHLKAPLVLASATPNYNDAERVYCIQHVLDPLSCRGGFLEFLYKHCITEQNPFGQTPNVLGFQHYAHAKDYLAALPGVQYLPDDLVYTIQDIFVPAHQEPNLDDYGYAERGHRMIASQIEEKHYRVNLGLIDDRGWLRLAAQLEIAELVEKADTPVLVFSAHATVAEAAAQTLYANHVKHGLITGTTSKKKKAAILAAFRDGVLDVLVGTASLATGTDGLDKVCDTLIILDDTEDDSLRRQLIGRIMPRGLDSDASGKAVYRLVLS